MYQSVSETIRPYQTLQIARGVRDRDFEYEYIALLLYEYVALLRVEREMNALAAPVLSAILVLVYTMMFVYSPSISSIGTAQLRVLIMNRRNCCFIVVTVSRVADRMFPPPLFRY